MTDLDAEATRARTVLLRKAIRPTFALRYTNDVDPVSYTFPSGQLEPVLVISDHRAPAPEKEVFSASREALRPASILVFNPKA